MPADLRGRIGRHEIVRSLKTENAATAKSRSRLLWAATETMFMTIREVPTVTPAEIEKLWAMASTDCRWADQLQVARTGRYFDVTGTAPVDVDAVLFETEAHEFRDALARNDIDPVRSSVAEYAGRLGLAVRPDSIDERILGRALLQVFAKESERAAARVRTEVLPYIEPFGVPATDELPPADAGSSEPDVGRAASRGVDARAAPPAVTSRFVGLTIEQLWPSFTGDQVSSRAWKQAIADQSFGTMRAWVKSVGASLPGEITSAPAAEFRRVVRRLPSNYAKCAAWRDLSFKEVAAAVEGTSYKPLAITTWNRHVSVMSKFWEWLLQNELVNAGRNPFEGLWIDADENLSVMEGGSEDRAMWSNEHLRRLFASPLFTGCQSPHRRHKPGTLLIRDALYWVVLIAALHGMRREEICQLRARHVVTDNDTGIVFFDLKAPGLKLKNVDSKRWVPLHRDLIELGFVSYHLADKGPDDALFPELEGQKNFGDKLGKQFTRYRRNAAIYERLLDLHSFRHTVSTLLIRQGVPQAHAEEITGHRSDARRTAFAIYDKGATLRILKDALDTLTLPLPAVYSGFRSD